MFFTDTSYWPVAKHFYQRKEPLLCSSTFSAVLHVGVCPLHPFHSSTSSPKPRSQEQGDIFILAPVSTRERTKAKYEAGVELSWSQWEECATTIASDHTSCLADSILGPDSGFSRAGPLTAACGLWRVSGKV